MIFHYTAGHGKQGTLTLVPSMSLLKSEYICVAEVEGNSMVVSNPRPLDEALNWAQNFCGSFCLL
jgi:hypothetical protein